ncbi:MAG: hypothetical protein EOP54_09895 [Sphingobacteriales bacterium]|nr:MAG: hypothetical protein EOP54_09895 [Sphingobacteriales bacterium]
MLVKYIKYVYGLGVFFKTNRQGYQGNEYIGERGWNGWTSITGSLACHEPRNWAGFLGVDALADVGGQQVLSPYHAMACNPAIMVDPFGLRSAVFDNGASAPLNAPFPTPILPVNSNARYILLDQIMYADQAAFHQEIRDRMEAEAEGEEAAKESATNGNSSNNNAPTNSSSSAAGNGAQAKSGESDEQSNEGNDQEPESGKTKKDPSGVVIVANVKDAVFGKGHSGLLIQKQDGTWQFISKEGREEEGGGSSNNALSGGPALKAVDLNYKTLGDFFADKKQSRYKRFAMVSVRDVNTVETTMRRAANAKYNIICANCGTAVNNALEVGGVKVGYFITPNSQFSAITSRNLIHWYYER